MTAHQGPRHRGDTVIDHPIQVAVLLAQGGYGQDVVTAGLLQPAPRKVRHYRRTAQTLNRVFPGLPFVSELQTELEDLIASHPANGR